MVTGGGGRVGLLALCLSTVVVMVFVLHKFTLSWQDTGHRMVACHNWIKPKRRCNPNREGQLIMRCNLIHKMDSYLLLPICCRLPSRFRYRLIASLPRRTIRLLPVRTLSNRRLRVASIWWGSLSIGSICCSLANYRCAILHCHHQLWELTFPYHCLCELFRSSAQSLHCFYFFFHAISVLWFSISPEYEAHCLCCKHSLMSCVVFFIGRIN